MKILNDCSFLTASNIKKIEDHYHAKYVFESCIKNLYGQWADNPCAIFYTENPHPKGSNYFAIYYNTERQLRITNGISAIEEPIQGIEIDGDIIYSRYRHDYREHKGVFIDGGRDYLRVGGKRLDETRLMMLKVDKDKLKVKK